MRLILTTEGAENTDRKLPWVLLKAGMKSGRWPSLEY